MPGPFRIALCQSHPVTRTPAVSQTCVRMDWLSLAVRIFNKPGYGGFSLGFWTIGDTHKSEELSGFNGAKENAEDAENAEAAQRVELIVAGSLFLP